MKSSWLYESYNLNSFEEKLHMQVCKYASMQKCKYESIEVDRYAMHDSYGESEYQQGSSTLLLLEYQ